jgi:Ubiquitin family
VKTINNESFSYSLPSTTIVSDLKRMLRDSTAIDIPRQRLIFRGRVLQDDLLLTDYSIACGNVLHMVARPAVDSESEEESRRARSQSASDPTGAQSSSHGFSHFSTENGGSLENISAGHENQLQRLSRNELELFNQLMTGESHSHQENIGGIIIQNQQDLQRQQMYSSDISSYSFQSASRFAVLPTVVAPGAPSSSTHANIGPTTSTSPRPNSNSSSESIERIRQGLLTMETIMSTMDRSVFTSSEHSRRQRSSDAAALTEPLLADQGKSVVSFSTIASSGSDNETSAASVFSHIIGDIPARGNAAVINVLNDGTSRKGESNADQLSSEAAYSTGKRKSQSMSGQQSNEKSSARDGCTEEAAQELSNNSGAAAVAELKVAARKLNSDLNEGNLNPSHSESEGPGEAAGGTGSGTGTSSSTGQRAEGSVRAHEIERERETRLFFVGQWVDVKDTVSQWLEATVMAVDLIEQRVFVHYNGWCVAATVTGFGHESCFATSG